MMRLVPRFLRFVLAMCAMLALTGCSSSISLGLTSGIQAGVSLGVSTIVGGFLQALAAPITGAVTTGF